MRVLITGANGFVGKNLVAALTNIRDGKDKTHPNLFIEEIFSCTRDTDTETLVQYCCRADFVIHLAGVNRPQNEDEFKSGNIGFTAELLAMLMQRENPCPIMFSSSVQANLTGRFAGSRYGESKQKCETLCFGYGRNTGADVFVYRFPNIFGKWCRPNYNSVVATFCHCIARDLPIRVDDPNTELELLYIDDLVEELLHMLEGHAHPVLNGVEGKEKDLAENPYYYVPVTHCVKLGTITELLKVFQKQSLTFVMPEIPAGSFEKKLYSTYLSYLPPEKATFSLHMNTDCRGSFTELLKTANCGQISVNVSKPGITKGEHWHNTKWELFIVVSGKALIRQRRLGSDEVIEFRVSGEKIEAVYMLPGYTHSIVNLSDTENLVTVMWANEQFDSNHPDTFREEV